MSFFDVKQPLWLPKGSVRALLTVGLAGAFIVLSFKGQVPEAILAVFTMVVKDYFGDRAKVNASE